MYNPFSLFGKKILITGASSGIGQAIAIECSKMGAHVIITGRNEERLKNTLNALEGEGHVSFIADITNREDVDGLVGSITEIDGIVHSAGVSKPLPFQFVTEMEVLNTLQPNFIAPVILSQLLIKNKRVKKGASIVFISSISGTYCTSTGGSLYSASKGAINAISKTMALELAGKAIRVNCINPGMIETNILDGSTLSEEQIQGEIKKYPLKRFGKPLEVAHAAIYLLSDPSQWVTGANLVIDGGYTIQ